MKSNDQSSLYFSMYPQVSEEQTPAAKSERQQTPYLRAILSEKLERTGRIVRLAISDKLAAIRYIHESKWRNNFCRG